MDGAGPAHPGEDAPRGADRVNDELEVGYDQRFERRWAWAERVGRVVMVVFVGAALAGLFGRGPFSHRTTTVTGSALAVDYEPVARVQTGTQVTLHLLNDRQSPTVDVFVSTQIVEPMGLRYILPQPVAERPDGLGMVLTLAMPPGRVDNAVRLLLQPAGIGLVSETARLAGHKPVTWRQLVLP